MKDVRHEAFLAVGCPLLGNLRLLLCLVSGLELRAQSVHAAVDLLCAVMQVLKKDEEDDEVDEIPCVVGGLHQLVTDTQVRGKAAEASASAAVVGACRDTKKFGVPECQ